LKGFSLVNIMFCLKPVNQCSDILCSWGLLGAPSNRLVFPALSFYDFPNGIVHLVRNENLQVTFYNIPPLLMGDLKLPASKAP